MMERMTPSGAKLPLTVMSALTHALASNVVTGARRHSDKDKFCRDLNHPKGCKMSERLLKTLSKFSNFQAEYEGSIPFTRSKAISMA